MTIDSVETHLTQKGLQHVKMYHYNLSFPECLKKRSDDYYLSIKRQAEVNS